MKGAVLAEVNDMGLFTHTISRSQFLKSMTQLCGYDFYLLRIMIGSAKLIFFMQN